MTRFLTVLAAGSAVALASIAAPTAADARCRGCGIAAAAAALYGVADAISSTPNPIIRNTAYFGLALALAFIAVIYVGREKLSFRQAPREAAACGTI